MTFPLDASHSAPLYHITIAVVSSNIPNSILVLQDLAGPIAAEEQWGLQVALYCTELRSGVLWCAVVPRKGKVGAGKGVDEASSNG
ncbi:MAG: hypothetical protein M1831_001836 [Alyxoria varia]|nr:MAG: hypothetical protein M1831_001836 [Alyxoria varia]